MNKNNVSFDNKTFFDLLKDPLWYLTLSLFVGESSLSLLKLPVFVSSSVMYCLMLIALFFMAQRPRFRVVSFRDPVVWFYVYLLIRNIPLKTDLFWEYWLPNLMTLLLIVLLCRFMFCDNQFERFLQYSYYFLLIMMALGLFKAILVGGRLSVFGGPNGYYKFALLFHVLSFGRFVFCRSKAAVIGMGVGIVLAILTGSKGAIVSILVIIPLEYIIYLLQRKSARQVLNRIIILFFCSVLLIVFAYLAVKIIPGFQVAYNRGVSILRGDVASLSSVSARTKMLELSIQYFIRSPLFGMGARYMYYDTLGTTFAQPYAHNVFFEMLGEQGAIGFILILTVFFSVFRAIKRIGVRNYLGVCLLLGFVVYFLGAQFSGNILDTKVVLLFSEMLIIITHKKRRSSYEDY